MNSTTISKKDSYSYEWIKNICDYEFNNLGQLIFTNKYNKKLIIPISYAMSFTEGRRLDRHELILKSFSESEFDYDFVDNGYIMIKINDISIKFNIFCDYQSSFSKLTFYQDKTYAYLTTLSNDVDFYISHLKHFTNVKNSIEYITHYFTKIYTRTLAPEHILESSSNIIVEVTDKKIELIHKIKPEYNDFIISELGKNASCQQISDLVTSFSDDTLDRVNKSITKLFKRKEDIIKVRKRFNDHNLIKSNFSKCLTEIKTPIDYKAELTKIVNDRNIIKFVEIWQYDNIRDFKSNCALSSPELKLVKHLYLLNNDARNTLLLENGIFI